MSLESKSLPRERNARVDLLSRFIDRNDGSLNPEVFKSLNARCCSTLGQGLGEEEKKEVKKATFPTLLTMIVVSLVHKFNISIILCSFSCTISF